MNECRNYQGCRKQIKLGEPNLWAVMMAEKSEATLKVLSIRPGSFGQKGRFFSQKKKLENESDGLKNIALSLTAHDPRAI